MAEVVMVTKKIRSVLRHDKKYVYYYCHGCGRRSEKTGLVNQQFPLKITEWCEYCRSNQTFEKVDV